MSEQGPWLFEVRGFVLYEKEIQYNTSNMGMNNGSKSCHDYHWLKDNEGNPQASFNRCRKEIHLNLLTAGEGCLPRLLVFLVCISVVGKILKVSIELRAD